MKWIFIIIGVLAILFVVKMVFSFIHETRQLNQSIREEGGMRCVCGTLVDGLMTYRGARVVKEDSNSISIDGPFYEPYSNTPCGFWRVSIFRSWDWISIKYTAHAGLGLGWTRKTWQFDKVENQQYILETMKPVLEKWVGMVLFGSPR